MSRTTRKVLRFAAITSPSFGSSGTGGTGIARSPATSDRGRRESIKFESLKSFSVVEVLDAQPAGPVLSLLLPQHHEVERV